MKNINFSSKRGFTLIELLVVIGILAVLAAIAIPSVAGLIDRANVSADNTNSNEMTNSMERFASEYELYCQDIAAGKIKNVANLDGAQARVHNVTKATTRSDIEKLESEDGFNGRAVDGDTNYPTNVETARAIVQVYTKTSSSTFEPKQSDAHYYYSPDCGIVVAQDTAKSDVASLNALVPSGLDANGQKLNTNTVWIDLTTGEDSANKTYTLEEIQAKEHAFAIGATKPEYVIGEYDTELTTLTIYKNGKNSDGLIAINPTELLGGYFYTIDCNIKTLIIEDGITIQSNFFKNFAKLNNIIIKDNVSITGDTAFYWNYNISNLSIGKNLVVTGDDAFGNCKAETVTIENATITGDRTLYGAKIKHLIINNSTINSYNMINECNNIISLEISNSTILNERVFSGCPNLKTVTISGNTKLKAKTMINYCNSLEKIIINNGVSIEETPIVNDCANLTEMYFNNNLPVSYFHSRCNNLKTLYFGKNFTVNKGIGIGHLSTIETIYCETQEVANLLNENNISTSRTKVIVDPNKF